MTGGSQLSVYNEVVFQAAPILQCSCRPFQVRGPTGSEALLSSRRGNPKWATPLHLGVVPAGESSFEHVVVMLRLSPEEIRELGRAEGLGSEEQK